MLAGAVIAPFLPKVQPSCVPKLTPGEVMFFLGDAEWTNLRDFPAIRPEELNFLGEFIELPPPGAYPVEVSYDYWDSGPRLLSLATNVYAVEGVSYNEVNTISQLAETTA